jgi:hypothetical protein
MPEIGDTLTLHCIWCGRQDELQESVHIFCTHESLNPESKTVTLDTYWECTRCKHTVSVECRRRLKSATHGE